MRLCEYIRRDGGGGPTLYHDLAGRLKIHIYSYKTWDKKNTELFKRPLPVLCVGYDKLDSLITLSISSSKPLKC